MNDMLYVLALAIKKNTNKIFKMSKWNIYLKSVSNKVYIVNLKFYLYYIYNILFILLNFSYM